MSISPLTFMLYLRHSYRRAIIAIRQDADVRSDSFAFFTSGRVAIRATLRAAFAFSHPAAVQRITLGA